MNEIYGKIGYKIVSIGWLHGCRSYYCVTKKYNWIKDELIWEIRTPLKG